MLIDTHFHWMYMPFSKCNLIRRYLPLYLHIKIHGSFVQLTIRAGSFNYTRIKNTYWYICTVFVHQNQKGENIGLAYEGENMDIRLIPRICMYYIYFQYGNKKKHTCRFIEMLYNLEIVQCNMNKMLPHIRNEPN